MKMDKTIYIGAMSGTSHDAIDVSIVDIKKTIVLKYFYSQKIVFIKYSGIYVVFPGLL